jgi:hypothetical protein
MTHEAPKDRALRLAQTGSRVSGPGDGRDSVSELIVYIDTSEIREGALEELKRAMNELVKFVEANEPRLIAYNVYIKEDGSRMTVVHVHRASASLEFHMKVAGPAFPKFAQFIELLTIDVYGKLSDDLLEQVRQKARICSFVSPASS